MSGTFPFTPATPESQGLSSRSVLLFLDKIQELRIGLESVILLRHGRLLAEGYYAPFSQDRPHRLFSAGKAVCMFAILFLLQEGKIETTTLMQDVFPDKMPEPMDDKLSRLNLGHLLSMTTGHDTDTFAPMLEPGADREAAFFAQRLVHEPGIHFLYNNGVPDMLQFILYRLTGEDLFDYLKPRLFDPLEMTNYRADRNGHLVELPTMAFTTRDLLKMTWVLADGGRWQGKELIRPDLVRQATAYQVPCIENPDFDGVGDHTAGYCWQMWRNGVGGFRLDGGQGQFGVVVPDADLVVAMNCGEALQDAVLQVLWEQIERKLYNHPLPEDPEGNALLAERLRTLTWARKNELSPAPGWEGSYQLATPLLERQRLTLAAKDGGISLATESGSLFVPMDGTWGEGEVPFFVPELRTGLVNGRVGGLRHDLVSGYDPAKCLASAAWTAPDTLEIHLRSLGWTGYHVLRFTFAPGHVTAAHIPGLGYNLEGRPHRYFPPYLEGRPQRPMPQVCSEGKKV